MQNKTEPNEAWVAHVQAENQRRAERGMKTLIQHQLDDSPLTLDDPVDYLMVADLLADLRHLCHWKNVEFMESVRLSREHYAAECQEDVDG
ncbi:MAG: hypothetical protein ACK443_05805 [Methylococcaceae bacterium]|jgi:hypothetical protein